MAAPGSQLLRHCCIITFTLIVLAVLAYTTANCIAGPLHNVGLLQPSGSSPATIVIGSSSNRTLIESSAVAFHNLSLKHQPHRHHLPSLSNRKLAFTHVHVDRSSLLNPPECQGNNGNWGELAAIKDGQLKRDQLPGAPVQPMSTLTWKHILSCVPLDCLTCLLSGIWGSSAAAVSWWSSRASLVSRSYKHLTQQEPFTEPHREPSSQVGHRELLDDTFPCRNADGAPVDWYTILKFPDGDHYAYIDSTFSPPAPGTRGPAGGYKWKVASGLAANATGPLAKTLLPLYGGQVNTSYIMYSDEYPEMAGHPAHFWGGGAHAKGVLGFGPGQGFWLSHSIPKTPGHPKEGYWGIHPPQLKYGQSMLCVSLGRDQLDTVGRVLETSGLWIYAARLAAPSQALYPHLQHLISFGPHRMARSSKAPNRVRGEIVRSLEGQKFALFAKRPTGYRWPIWLYEQLVEPFFGLPMAWETWQNGEAWPQPSGCNGTRFRSYTIKQVAVPEAETVAPMWSWGVHADHSKWGVPFDIPIKKDARTPGQSRAPVTVCLSDMNRQMSQGRRGGGAICFLENRAIFESFRKLVVDVKSCTEGEGLRVNSNS